MSGSRPIARRPPPRGLRRVLLIAAVDLAVLALVLLTVEVSLRVRDEGGLRAGIASLWGGRVRMAASGDTDWLEADPELGYVLDRSHGPVSSLGIRHGELGPKPPDLFRLVVLGDSVSWEQDGWVGTVRDELARGARPAEVVNAAIPGYTTHQERLLFERGLAAAAPDVVLLQYCLNDNHLFLHELADGAWLVRADAKRALLPPEGGLLGSLVRRSRLAFEVRKRLYLAREKRGGFFPWDASPDFAPAWRAESWDLQRDELARLAASAVAAGARLAVVVVPYEPQLGLKYLERDRGYALYPQLRLGELCGELELPLLDVHAAFFAARDERLYVPGDPVHLSPAGHALLAREVLAFLEREGLAPPR